ncbi:unnamed protein product [Cylindrotheca closterium]|uniref:Globin family profile domain-containing protein n=1 Tax=Cylindrotheca closterium TaxID=2856 RepID=A0AAD2FYZ8_9STRA|nr:unnamed protein product [Cylindrotheca closterium]
MASKKYKVELPAELRDEGYQEIKVSLLSKAGDPNAVDVAINGFVDALFNDDELKPIFEKYSKPHLKAHQQRLFLMAITDLPADFDYKSFIMERHYKLFDKGVNEKHFDLMVKYLNEALATLSVDPEIAGGINAHLAPFRDVFETTSPDDVKGYLKKSIGSLHMIRIAQAKRQREQEIEEHNRRASMGSTFSEQTDMKSEELG